MYLVCSPAGAPRALIWTHFITKTLKNMFFNVFVMNFNVCYVFKKKT